MNDPSNAPIKAIDLIENELRMIQQDTSFDGLIVNVEPPFYPSHTCPEAAPDPREAVGVTKNEYFQQLRVRASLLVSGKFGAVSAGVHHIRIELDIDTRTYPSYSHLPTLWVRFDLAGIDKDGSLGDSFYNAVKASPEKKANPIAAVLWHFSRNFLREVSDYATEEQLDLRFKIGDVVLANIGQWAPGKVVALWDQGYPYKIRLLDRDTNGMEVYAPFDSDEAIRSLATSKVTEDTESTECSTWPENARVPHHAWVHNLKQWQKAHAFSQNPLEMSLYKPEFSLAWWAKWLDSDLLSWLSGGGRADRPDFINELSPGIFSFSLFTLDFCGKLLSEVERCEKMVADNKQLDISRPNSMNKGGAIMSELGLCPLMDSLQDHVLQHLARVLFPTVGSDLTQHHSFVVRYSRTEDRELDMHTDDSDVTFNVCLGRDFKGSSLQFCGVLGSPLHRQESLRYHHKLGHCVVHLGAQRHGAEMIQSGERINLISWNGNKVWRRSSGFLHPLYQIDYKREAGPPDPVCLSRTHDVDWEQYRGERPGSHARPWCPPAFARHARPNKDE